MSTPPKVSVCIPTYNHGHYLAGALASALGQTFVDMEIIVSDNCSTDATPALVERLADEDRRIRYSRTTTHLDMQSNFNRCIELARGRYVKFLCADDILDENCVERMTTAFDYDPDVKLIACARRVISNTEQGARILRYSGHDVVCAGTKAARRCFFHGNLIGEPTAVMFRRMDSTEGFSRRFVQLMDLEMWFRLLEHGKFAFLSEPLCSIRHHDDQTTVRSIASGRITEDKESLFHDYAIKNYLKASILEKLLWDFRMAWSMRRERAGGRLRESSDAMYFPRLAPIMGGLAGLAWTLALRS